MNVPILKIAIPMQLVKTHKVVLSVIVKLAILEMANCAQVKLFSSVCVFVSSKNLHFEKSNNKRKNWGQKKQFC
jgi:hypothetical protein